MKKYIIEEVKKILEQETSYYNLKNITDINKEYINSPEFNDFIDTLLNPDKKIIFEMTIYENELEWTPISEKMVKNCLRWC